MWRADQYDAPGASGLPSDTPPWWSKDLAHQVSVGEPDAVMVNHAEETWQQWREEIAALGGPSPLTHFHDRPDNRIDITRGHPGGLARFLAGSPTLLGNLIRDDVARRPAHQAAVRLLEHQNELRHTRGLDTIALGIGLVEWQFEGEYFAGPLLMRPVKLRRRGGDVEVTLRRSRVRLNPGLQRAFADQLGVSLDSKAFVALTDDDGAFKPNPALDRLRDLTAHRGDVTVQARLVISSFADVSHDMTEDANNLEHTLLEALGGNETAKESVRRSRMPVELIPADAKPADADRFVLDADQEAEVVLANIQGGNSLVVRVVPGAGSTQVVANALAALIAQNKRALVVSPRPASLQAVADRLREVGLPGVAAHVDNPGPDLIASISRNEKAKKPSVRDVDKALDRLRSVITLYREALSKKDPELGVSAQECFQKLGSLSLLPQPPETTARLSHESLVSLAGGLGQAAELLARAAELGEFTWGPDDTPWYGVSFDNVEDAKRSHERAKRLYTDTLPRLIEKIGPVLAQTPLPPAQSVGQMGVFVRLLVDMRDSLDRFQPSVFDRSVRDLVTATGPMEVAKSMPRLQRRRLKALAKEYVRPGVHVSDLHEALVKIQSQREIWNRYVETGHPPTVPSGLADAHVVCQEVEQDLAELDRVLGRTGPGARLADLSIAELSALLGRLAEQSQILESLETRQGVVDHLASWHLEPLVADLASRHVDATRVAGELELAWWRGALETILQKEEALLGSDQSVLERMEADYRLVDEAHLGGNAQLVSWNLAERWSLGLVDWPEEKTALKTLLKTRQATISSLHAQAPHLTKALAPVWLASPYRVHLLPETLRFDAVFLLDSGAVTIPEVAAAIRRAPQVIAIGDPVTQVPSPFRTAALAVDDRSEVDHDAWHERSAFAELSALLPGVSITKSQRASGDDLARVVATALYSGQPTNVPWAGSFLGHPAIALEEVEDGQGLPDPKTGVVESVDAEVKAVVKRVVEHALTRPTESLMVITASATHAGRVHDAIVHQVAQKPDIASFFTKESAEPFDVLTIDHARAITRDRVIFSLGYGRTPHGRVLSDLGPLSAPGGERLVAVALTRARSHLRVISCVGIEHLRDPKLPATTRALGDSLQPALQPSLAPDPDLPRDPMLVDLARRLEAKGLEVVLDYQGQIPLAARYGGYCIAVDTDASLMRLGIREGLRHRPAALQRAGWHYVRAHALELFTTPDVVADKIATLVGLHQPTTGTRVAQEPGTPAGEGAGESDAPA